MGVPDATQIRLGFQNGGNYSGSCCNSIDKAGYFMSCMSFRIYPN